MKMSSNMDLRQVESFIQDNIKNYRDQFQKDANTFTEVLKKEYETIKVSLNGMIDGLVDRFNKQTKENLDRERDAFSKSIMDTFEQMMQSMLQDFEWKGNKRLELAKKQIMSDIQIYLKDYIEENSKEIIKSFFFKKKKKTNGKT
jgi:vacuolar-type H+-ATPase subunit E/Vma4